MDLETAVEALQELVDQVVTVRLSDNGNSVKPFRVKQVDYFAKREHRCVVVRVDPEGYLCSLRRPVADVTRNPLYFDADATIARAPLADVETAVERYAFDCVGA